MGKQKQQQKEGVETININKEDVVESSLLDASDSNLEGLPKDELSFSLPQPKCFAVSTVAQRLVCPSRWCALAMLVRLPPSVVDAAVSRVP